MFGKIRQFFVSLLEQTRLFSEHNKYCDLFDKTWNKLQDEKSKNGMSPKYWDIWHNEVCPLYEKMTSVYKKLKLVPPDILSDKVLEDMRGTK